MGNSIENKTPPLTAPLTALHKRLGARMVDFAGYQMPLHYEAGILAEHRQTRTRASLFDVSHMGQAMLHASAEALEKIFPTDLITMADGQMRYSFLLNDEGGIIDDMMITRYGESRWHLIVNAASRDKDFAYLGRHIEFSVLEDRALLALQGPKAAEIITPLAAELTALPFMTAREVALTADRLPALVSRSGYTGEDGYEISIAAAHAEILVKTLLSDDRLKLAGLGARDSLRLEAGLCLYGQDIDETITPIEAGLGWAIAKRRRTQGGFPAAEKIISQLQGGVGKRRVGFIVDGRRPVRHAARLFTEAGEEVGHITSGGVAADCIHPIAMGYIQTALASCGTLVLAEIRGKKIAARVAALPFRSHRYFKKSGGTS